MKKFPVYPILLAVFPILSLWAANLLYVGVTATYRSFLVILLGTFLLWGILAAVFRDVHKSALITSLAGVLFFSYGRLYPVIEDVSLLGFNIGRHRYLVLAFGVILFLLAWRIVASKKDFSKINSLMLLVGVGLVALPVFQITSHYIRQAGFAASQNGDQLTTQRTQPDVVTLTPPADGVLPDIYYIILDSYGRADVLKDCFQYDIQPFLNGLESEGFVTAERSQTNFTITDLSLTASLNMDYPQALAVKPAQASDPAVLHEWAVHNTVRNSLEKIGYKTVAFDSGYGVSQWEDADVYYVRSSGARWLLGGINPFEDMLLNTTLGTIVFQMDARLPTALRVFLDGAHLEHRQRMLDIMDNLVKVPDNPEPTFTFVHILAPHNPFVFGPDGEYVSRNTPFTLNNDQDIKDGFVYISGYTDQVIYLNKRFSEIIDEIIQKSDVPPVIILQGDHGPSRWVTSTTGRSFIDRKSVV